PGQRAGKSLGAGQHAAIEQEILDVDRAVCGERAGRQLHHTRARAADGRTVVQRAAVQVERATGDADGAAVDERAVGESRRARGLCVRAGGGIDELRAARAAVVVVDRKTGGRIVPGGVVGERAAVARANVAGLPAYG